jgi:rRNA maturation endonuclease Nob1
MSNLAASERIMPHSSVYECTSCHLLIVVTAETPWPTCTICGGETTHVAEQKVIKAYAL